MINRYALFEYINDRCASYIDIDNPVMFSYDSRVLLMVIPSLILADINNTEYNIVNIDIELDHRKSLLEREISNYKIIRLHDLCNVYDGTMLKEVREILKRLNYTNYDDGSHKSLLYK